MPSDRPGTFGAWLARFQKQAFAGAAALVALIGGGVRAIVHNPGVERVLVTYVDDFGRVEKVGLAEAFSLSISRQLDEVFDPATQAQVKASARSAACTVIVTLAREGRRPTFEEVAWSIATADLPLATQRAVARAGAAGADYTLSAAEAEGADAGVVAEQVCGSVIGGG